MVQCVISVLERYNNNVLQNRNRDFWFLVEWKNLDHSFVVASMGQWLSRISQLASELTVDIISTFCDGFMVQRVKLMLSKFFRVLLLDCFVCR